MTDQPRKLTAIERRDRLDAVLHNLRVEGVLLDNVNLSATDAAVAFDIEGDTFNFDGHTFEIGVDVDPDNPRRAFKMLRAGINALETFTSDDAPDHILDAEFETDDEALGAWRRRAETAEAAVREYAADRELKLPLEAERHRQLNELTAEVARLRGQVAEADRQRRIAEDNEASAVHEYQQTTERAASSDDDMRGRIKELVAALESSRARVASLEADIAGRSRRNAELQLTINSLTEIAGRRPQINLNDYAWVKLTPQAAELMLQSGARPSSQDAKGRVRYLLWELGHGLGPSWTTGGPELVVGNMIEIEVA